MARSTSRGRTLFLDAAVRIVKNLKKNNVYFYRKAGRTPDERAFSPPVQELLRAEAEEEMVKVLMTEFG